MWKKKYYRSWQGTDQIRRVRMAYWVSRATNTHSEYVVLVTFHRKNGYTNAPQCYVIRTLPALFSQTLVRNCALLGYYAVGSSRVRNYHYLLRNNPEERSSQLLRCGSLKSIYWWWSLVLLYLECWVVLGRAPTEAPTFAQKTKAVAPLRFWWISRRTIPRCYQHHLSAEAHCNCGSHQRVVPPVTTGCRNPRPSVYLPPTRTPLSASTYKRQVTMLTFWQNCGEVHGVVVNFPEWFYRAGCVALH